MKFWRFYEMPAPGTVVIKEFVLWRRVVVIDVWVDRARPCFRRVLLVFASCPRGSRWLYHRRGFHTNASRAAPHSTTSYDKAQEWSEVASA